MTTRASSNSALCQDNSCVNVGSQERQLSLLVGGSILVGGLLLARTRSLMTAAIGLGLLYRGYTGHCLTYELLGMTTAEEGESMERPAAALPHRATPAMAKSSS